MSEDTSIFKKQKTSCLRNRDSNINVQVVEYRYLKLRLDAYLNIYGITHAYNYPYLLEYIEIFLLKYIDLRSCV